MFSKKMKKNCFVLSVSSGCTPRKHYYTGQYHAHQPCTQSWPCSEKRGGIGGGLIPTKTPFSAPSRCYSEGLGESFVMDDDGVADVGLEGQGFEVRGVWWTCGAWSIMGRYVGFFFR